MMSAQIDYARVVRRADLGRRAARTATVSTGVTGVLLIAYLLVPSWPLLVVVVLAALVLVGAVGVRLWLARAPLPHVLAGDNLS